MTGRVRLDDELALGREVAEVLELVRAVRTDRGTEEVRRAIVKLAKEAREAKSPAFYTYNKLLRLIEGTP